MPRNWSTDSLPIVIKGDLRRMWGILAIVWVVVLVPAAWWLLSHPGGGGSKGPMFLIIVALFPIGLTIDFLRRSYRVRLRVTEEGVAIEYGSKVEFDRFAACSDFHVLGFALRWKAETAGGMRDRGIGPGLGLSREELRSLCTFLNERSTQERTPVAG